MTREEAIKTLSVLKAAYPNFYKGMTKDEANGTINVWATQFIDMPYFIVQIAINKLVSTNTFPPSIHEVKDRIRSLYWEAWHMLDDHKKATVGIKLSWHDVEGDHEEIEYSGKKLDDKTLEITKKIVEICEPMRTQERIEPSLASLISGFNAYLLGENSDKKQLK